MKVRALTSVDAGAISAWRYPDRYSTYDVRDRSVLDRDHWAVTDAGWLIGYCCFGAPARVPGATEEDGTLDVGYGLRPDLIGRGAGHDFVAAILEFAAGQFAPQRFRVHILDWNGRSRRVAEGHDFSIDSVLQSTEGRFVVMVRRA